MGTGCAQRRHPGNQQMPLHMLSSAHARAFGSANRVAAPAVACSSAVTWRHCLRSGGSFRARFPITVRRHWRHCPRRQGHRGSRLAGAAAVSGGAVGAGSPVFVARHLRWRVHKAVVVRRVVGAGHVRRNLVVLRVSKAGMIRAGQIPRGAWQARRCWQVDPSESTRPHERRVCPCTRAAAAAACPALRCYCQRTESGPGSPGAQSLLTVNFGYLGGPHVGGGGIVAVGAGGGAAALRAAAAEGRLRTALRVRAQLAGDAALRRKVGLRQAEVAGCQTMESRGSSLHSHGRHFKIQIQFSTVSASSNYVRISCAAPDRYCCCQHRTGLKYRPQRASRPPGCRGLCHPLSRSWAARRSRC